ncbi:MAG: TonB-dependent receptor [Bacteroidales bacterium]|nr:TonB-dependent receptor [Bacteroidales bacterium]
MTLKKTLSFLTAIFFIFGSTFSQETEDSLKNEPILDVEHALQNTSDRTIIGCTMQEIIPLVYIYADRSTPTLTQSSEYINSVEIDRKDESSILPVLKEQVPGLFINSQGVAGYGVSSGASGNITMRGFSGSAGRLLILIDGHPQYAPIYGHPMADTYTTDNIQGVEVVHGAASLLYGSNAMGGAINFITKEPNNGNTFRMRAKYGSYATTNCMVSDGFKHEKLTLFASGNYEHSNGYRENSEFNSLNAFAKIGYIINRHWRLTANANISHFDIEMPGSVSVPLNECEANVTRGIYTVMLDNIYHSDHYRTMGNLDVYYNWGRHQINDGFKEGEKPQEYLFHSTDYMGGVNLKQSTYIGQIATELICGFNLKLYGGNAYRNPVTEIYADHLSFSETAGYILASKRLFIKDLEKIRIKTFPELGLRAENHSLYGTILIPMAGILCETWNRGYQRNSNSEHRLSYSKGFRTPNMRELYMYAAANAELLPEHCHNFEYSIDYEYIKPWIDLSTKFNIYHTIGDNIVQTVMIDGKPKNQNVGEFKNTGVEFSTSIMKAPFEINADYSFVYMEQPIVGSPRQKVGLHIRYFMKNTTLKVGTQYIDKLYLAVGQTEATKSFALIDAKISQPIKMVNLFVQCETAICKGDYETMLGYPLPKVTCSAGVSVDLYKENKNKE